jgi:hypothetical protein
LGDEELDMIFELSVQSAVWIGLSGVAAGIAICVLAQLVPVISARRRWDHSVGLNRMPTPIYRD